MGTLEEIMPEDLSIIKDRFTENSEKYRILFEQASDGIFISDKNGIFTDVNIKGCQITGYTEEEILKMKVEDIIFEEDLIKKPLKFDEIIYGKKITIERNLKCKNGSAIVVEATSNMLSDGRIIAIVREITSWKENEERLNRIIENIPLGIIIIKAPYDKEIFFTNNELKKIFGFDDEDFKTFSGWMTKAFPEPDYRKSVIKEWYRDIKVILNGISSKSPTREYIITSKNKIEKNIEICFSIFNDTLYCVVNDISEKRMAEKALWESEHKYGELLNTLQEGVWVIDEKGYTVFVNPRMPEMLGYESVNEMIGHHLFEFMDEKGKNISIGNIEKGKNIIRGSHEFVFQKKDGSKLHAHLETGPVFDNKNDYKGLIAAVSDISSLKENEFSLKKAKEDAERALNVRNNFFATMSHEIRTPMNSIIGFSDLLYNELEDSLHKEFVDSIRSSGKVLLNLINDILELSKIESEDILIKEETVDINDLCEEIKNMFSVVLFQKKLNFSINTIPEIFPLVLIDKMRLRQIIVNLIGNSVNFTDKGSIFLNIELNNFISIDSEQKADIMITVKDTGIGISPDEQKNMFEPFKQMGNLNVKKHYGTGLGLSINRHLVEILKGKITFDSMVGEGTSFNIYLPSVKLLQEQTEKKNIPEKSTIFQESIDSDSFNILLVDDSEMNRKLIKSFLKKQKIKFIEAEDGQQAVDFAEQFKPDLILMDLRMPVISGYEANKIIKTKKSLSEIPVIALTAYSYEDFDFKNALFDDFIEKPIDKEILITKVEKFMNVPRVFHTHSDGLYTENHDKSWENEFRFKFMEASKNNSFDDLRNISEQITELGKSYSLKPVENFGKSLLTHVEFFDLESIKNLLSSFNDVIEKIYSDLTINE